MPNLLKSALAAAVVTAAASAQFAILTPPGYATVEGNANNAFPWNRNAASMHCQFIHDSSQFTSQSVNVPVLINRLRYRRDASTTTIAGGSWPQVQIKLATCTADYLTPSTTFANNLGANATVVHNGQVTVLGGPGNGAGVPGPFYIDIPLAVPFLYDPATGDLVVDIELTGAGWSGTSAQCDHMNATAVPPALVTRIYDSTTGTPNGATGVIGANYGPVCEFGYVPAQGLYASFSANVTNGVSPLNVQFTDHSYTSDPAGITAWLWDLDGDNVVDSAVQNPTFTYGCGSYTVSLQVFDNANPPSTLTRNNYINTDPLTVSFTSSVITGSTYQFTDTSSPTPQAWLWDLDGDNVTDSVLQNPTFTYPANCTTYNVTLTAILNCRIVTASRSIAVAPATATAVPFTGGNGTTSATHVGNMFEMVVTAPEGISVCAIEQAVYTYVGPFTADIYVTENTYLGKEANAAAWRFVGTGSGVSAGGGTTTPSICRVPLTSSFYLPAGSYGMVVFLSQPAGTMYICYTNGPQGPIVNPDVTFFPNPATAPGMVRTGLFTTGNINSRCWNGRLHYTKTSISQTAGFGYMNSGCASAMGVSRLTITGQPRIGQNSTLNVDNMPFSSGMLAVGFSRTMSTLGPLPLSLGTFGLPGCTLYVSPDVLVPLVGAGNTASFTTIVPNSPAVIGARFYSQALVNDPAANTFGGVVSDAGGGIVGQ